MGLGGTLQYPSIQKRVLVRPQKVKPRLFQFTIQSLRRINLSLILAVIYGIGVHEVSGFGSECVYADSVCVAPKVLVQEVAKEFHMPVSKIQSFYFTMLTKYLTSVISQGFASSPREWKAVDLPSICHALKLSLFPLLPSQQLGQETECPQQIIPLQQSPHTWRKGPSTPSAIIPIALIHADVTAMHRKNTILEDLPCEEDDDTMDKGCKARPLPSTGGECNLIQ